MDASTPFAPIRESQIESFLQANSLVRHWLSRWKPVTQKLYAIDIIKFELLSHTRIEELLLRLENNQIKPREIRSLIETSLADLPNSVQARMDSAVRGFFKHHYGKLPDTTIKYLKIRDYRAYHKDELQALIGFLDKPLEQLFAIIATESGLRGGTVLQLKWRHIESDFNNRVGPMAIRLEHAFHVGRKKSGFTFIGHRARQLIRRSTETSKSERGYRIYTESDRDIFPYSYDSILAIIKTAKNKAQLHDPALSPIHSFRKFFREQLTNAEIHPDHIKVLFGRFDDTDAKEYTSKEFETLRPEYEHAYPYLDYMNNAPEQAQKLSTKQTELQDLIKQQNERIQALQDQVGPINQALSALGDVFGQALPRKFQNNTSNASLREILTELIPLSIKFGKQFGQKPPPNFVQIATKGAEDIPEEELKQIEQLVKNGDLATAFTKMTKYIPIELSQYQPLES